MPIKVELSRTIESAEVVREARSIAWIGCLVFALSPTSYIFYLALALDSMSFEQVVLFVVLPGLLLVRTVIVALKLGRNLTDHEYLANTSIPRNPHIYLAKQILTVSDKCNLTRRCTCRRSVSVTGLAMSCSPLLWQGPRQILGAS